jgi:hypothetical protein
MTGGWINLNNEQLHNLYSSPSITRMIKSRRLAMYAARMREKRDTCSLLMGRSEGKRPLGRPRLRWMNNVKMDLREMEYGCIDLAEDRKQRTAVVNTIMNFRVPQNSGKFLSGCTTGGL